LNEDIGNEYELMHYKHSLF